MLWICAACAPCVYAAENLTPRDEPRDNSFYVCYADKFDKQNFHRGVYDYHRYEYIGCTISRTPCHRMAVTDPNNKDAALEANPKRMQLFYWYNNYYSALNAFYRCAYNT